MPVKLILNRGHEERVEVHNSMEQAFDAALPRMNEGYIARVTDENDVVQYTQVIRNGQIAVYRDDQTYSAPAPAAEAQDAAATRARTPRGSR